MFFDNEERSVPLPRSDPARATGHDGEEDLDEPVAWVKRCPNPMPGPSEIEIRPLYEATDLR